MKVSFLGCSALWLFFSYVPNAVVVQAQTQYKDRWNYGETEERGDGFTDYGQRDWGRIRCDEKNQKTLDECLAYRDKWHTGVEWSIKDNYCKWCPEGTRNCGGVHHQSPINLERNRGLGYWDNDGKPGAGADNMAKECIDVHWMKYEDSNCNLEQLEDADAFTVERHALRIAQPVEFYGNNQYRIMCTKPGKPRRFGRIDYSKGFSQWWFLSHIDFHTPSEHTQEGKRYDGEIQLYHFYSVGASEAGVNNEMGTVSVFMEAYDDAPPYRYLDKVICQWRRHEHMVREGCGLEPVPSTYPGCFPLFKNERQLKRRSSPKKKERFQTVHDIILYNDQHQHLTNDTSTLPKLIMDDANFEPAEEKDWERWIEEQSEQMSKDDAAYSKILEDAEEDEDLDDAHESFRKLLAGDEIEWFNYFPLLGVRTEYYYRYSGTQTIPPCYGNFQPDSRKGTNHWRVMKDPIRIHPRQLEELQRLLKERIAPFDDPVNACQPDTAAKVDQATGEVEAAREVQYWNNAHFKVYCECKDWRSKWPEDRKWCDFRRTKRFYEHPYNFETDGF